MHTDTHVYDTETVKPEERFRALKKKTLMGLSKAFVCESLWMCVCASDEACEIL